MPSPSTPPGAGETRTASLRRLTRANHERLDHAVMARGIFQDRQQFARFLCMQHRFHASIAPLYHRDDLRAHFPELPRRARLDRIAGDLRDLGRSPAAAIPPAGMQHAGMATALGWLYVAEGSALGGAVILKLAAPLGVDAGFGASHLAPAADGVAANWRDFTARLDRIALPAEAEAAVIEGAQAAFAAVHAHLLEAFA